MTTAKTLITGDIKDSVVNGLSLWSSQKIQTEIAAASVNLSGYAQKVSNQDFEITDFNKGIILTAPDATRVRVQVEAHPDLANAYILTTTSL